MESPASPAAALRVAHGQFCLDEGLEALALFMSGAVLTAAAREEARKQTARKMNLRAVSDFGASVDSRSAPVSVKTATPLTQGRHPFVGSHGLPYE